MLEKKFLFLLFLITVFAQVQASTSYNKQRKIKVVPIEIKVVPKKHSDSESSEETRETERTYAEDEISSRSRKIAPETLIECCEEKKQPSTNMAITPQIRIAQETKKIMHNLEKSDEIKKLIKSTNLSSVQTLRDSISENADAVHIDYLHETRESRVTKRLAICINKCLENGSELFADEDDFNELKSLCKNSCKRQEARTLKEIKERVGEACIAYKLNQATQKKRTAFDIATGLFRPRNSKLTNN